MWHPLLLLPRVLFPEAGAALGSSGHAAPAAGRERYKKQVERWNETHKDDQLVFNKAGVAQRKQKSRADAEKQARRQAERALKKEIKAKRCAPCLR